MKVQYILLNAIAALGLFFLNGWLGKVQYGLSNELFSYGKFTFESNDDTDFSGNFFQKIVTPTVYLAAMAVIVQRFFPCGYVESMWLLIPIFWAYRVLFMLLKNVFVFLNLKYEAFALVLSLGLGETVFFKIIMPLVHESESLWLSTTELRDALWFAILVYLAKTIWEIAKQSFSGENLYPNDKRRELINKRYVKFTEKYGEHVEELLSGKALMQLSENERERLGCLLYAIMIYEDYNRPFLFRKGEVLMKKTLFSDRDMTFGIMQVKSDYALTDIESIDLAFDIISQPFLSHASAPEEVAISRYNNSEEYGFEVRFIFGVLKEQFSDLLEETADNESYMI